MSADTLTIKLDPELRALFRRYEAHMQVTAEYYIDELLAKTRPTLQAMVEALDEAAGNPEALAQLFGHKMASLMQQQKGQVSA
jgi:putative heme degradation protein